MGGVRLGSADDTLPYRQLGSTRRVQIKEGEGEGGRDFIDVDGLRPP